MLSQNQSQPDRQRDFFLGFWGWWAITLIGAAATTGLAFASRTAAIGFGAALLLLNLVVPIYLAFRRPYMAFGIIVAFASVTALTVVEGVFSTIADFIGFGGGAIISGPAGSVAAGNFLIGTFVVAGIIGLVGFVIGARIVLRRVARRL